MRDGTLRRNATLCRAPNAMQCNTLTRLVQLVHKGELLAQHSHGRAAGRERGGVKGTGRQGKLACGRHRRKQTPPCSQEALRQATNNPCRARWLPRRLAQPSD